MYLFSFLPTILAHVLAEIMMLEYIARGFKLNFYYSLILFSQTPIISMIASFEEQFKQGV